MINTPRCIVALLLMVNAAMAEDANAAKPQAKFKGPVKVFILAGQSNMEGYGGVKTLDRLGEHPTHGYLLKKIKNADGSHVVRDDVFVSYQRGGERIKRQNHNPEEPDALIVLVRSSGGRRPAFGRAALSRKQYKV